MSKEDYIIIQEQSGKVSIKYDSKEPQYTWLRNTITTDGSLYLYTEQIDDFITVLTKLKEQL